MAMHVQCQTDIKKTVWNPGMVASYPPILPLKTRCHHPGVSDTFDIHIMLEYNLNFFRNLI
jgi:hypothetical protein